MDNTKRAQVRNVRDFTTGAEAAKANIDVSLTLVDEIRELLTRSKHRRLNWSHAGDAAHHATQLADVRDALAGIGEYS